MSSRYLMAVIDRETQEIVEYEPGHRAEKDFIDDCVARTLRKGVGFGRTAAHVEQDLRAALDEAVFELKARIRPH